MIIFCIAIIFYVYYIQKIVQEQNFNDYSTKISTPIKEAK